MLAFIVQDDELIKNANFSIFILFQVYVYYIEEQLIEIRAFLKRKILKHGLLKICIS